MKTLIFGGSFNPPHWGHVFAVCKATSLGEFDNILVIPAYQHPYDKPLEKYSRRIEMCSIAFEWIPRVQVRSTEYHLNSTTGQRIYMYDVVNHFIDQDPSPEVHLLGGKETANDMDNWHRSDELKDLVYVMVIDREDGVMPGISSTEIRDKLAGNDWQGSHDIEAMVPKGVLEYIQENGLYSEKKNGLYDGKAS